MDLNDETKMETETPDAPAATAPISATAKAEDVLVDLYDNRIAKAKAATVAGRTKAADIWRLWAFRLRAFFNVVPPEATWSEFAAGAKALAAACRMQHLPDDDGYSTFLLWASSLVTAENAVEPSIHTVCMWGDMAQIASGLDNMGLAGALAYEATCIAMVLAGRPPLAESQDAAIVRRISDAYDDMVRSAFPDAVRVFDARGGMYMASGVLGASVALVHHNDQACLMPCDVVEAPQGRMAVLSKDHAPVPVIEAMRLLRVSDPPAFAAVLATVKALAQPDRSAIDTMITRAAALCQTGTAEYALATTDETTETPATDAAPAQDDKA